MNRRHRLHRATSFLLVLAAPLAHGWASAGDPAPPSAPVPGWYARLDTSKGRIVARLLPEQSPQAVAYFAALAEGRLEWFDRHAGEMRKGRYYDGIAVHKVVAGGQFEAGDPLGLGRGAPDLYLPLEGLGPVNFSRPGRLGMTRAGGRISAVQFFVTASGTPWLNGSYPCFGVVVEGLDVVEAITVVEAYSNGRPVAPPVIERVEIFAVGEPAPLPMPEPWKPPFGELKERPGMRATEPD